MTGGRHLVTVADDFGLCPAVNHAIDHAARDGMLTAASLMVGAPYARQAVELARANPKLKVGLHLVVVEGPAVLPPRVIPDLVDGAGQFPRDQVRLGLKYAFHRRAIAQLRAEIEAQYRAFAATGLRLDHVNAHKHMHLHPVVGQLAITIGRAFGVRAMRVPCDPTGNKLLAAWTGLLRRQARRAGILTNDTVRGLADTGHMTPGTAQKWIDALPDGLTELYFHPAIESAADEDAVLRRLMPDYEHAAEYQALLRARLPADVRLTSYTDYLT